MNDKEYGALLNACAYATRQRELAEAESRRWLCTEQSMLLRLRRHLEDLENDGA
jgi:hypothetical protein